MNSRRIVNTKVKSGCRTCKIRKIKCDEGRPACDRCVSTGRDCDGYGIWGGGSHHQCLTRDEAISRPVSVFLVSGTKEKGHFEWFRCRTATKLQGSFNSCFWNTLLFQASLSEPAILHAVLALSSVHKTGVCHPENPARIAGNIPDEQEQFTLAQYVKAISHLRPHFSSKDRASSRIALIACVLFISLDLLRGHFTTAEIHLQKGLRVLQEMQVSLNSSNILSGSSYRGSTDDWIIVTFLRLQLQLELFKYSHQHPYLYLEAQGIPVPRINSINDAWNLLQRALNDIFYLTHQARQTVNDALIKEQQRIRAELARWLDMFEMFYKGLHHLTLYEQKSSHLLSIYHAMAGIMIDTCLSPGDELVYDSHTEQFVTLIAKLESLWSASPTTNTRQILPGYQMDMSKSVMDVGWIPPLFYTAIKCRVHRIRLQAAGMLERTFHREGMWDSKSMACAARKVIQLEEGDFYGGIDTQDDFDLCGPSSQEDSTLPTLPESHRLREVEVVLSGNPMDTISLFCKQTRTNRRVLLSEYNIHVGQWKDEIH